jgi:glycosyltransferase involved in cell wall biosynthesis
MYENTHKISIIVAVYNIENYVSRCVDSILAQTYSDLQVILVDDGSTDDSGTICDKYAKKDNRIETIHKKNGGLSDARNAGIDKADGDYIGFVDGDDWIEPFMYEKMLGACLENNAEIAICRYNQIGGHPDWEEPDGKILSLTSEEAMNLYLCGNKQHVIYNSVWSKLFKRNTIEGLQFAVGRNSEDILYTTQAFCNAERFVYLDIPCYNYVCDREDSIITRKLPGDVSMTRYHFGECR